jgi:hypothetical protein
LYVAPMTILLVQTSKSSFFFPQIKQFTTFLQQE